MWGCWQIFSADICGKQRCSPERVYWILGCGIFSGSLMWWHSCPMENPFWPWVRWYRSFRLCSSKDSEANWMTVLSSDLICGTGSWLGTESFLFSVQILCRDLSPNSSLDNSRNWGPERLKELVQGCTKLVEGADVSTTVLWCSDHPCPLLGVTGHRAQLWVQLVEQTLVANEQWGWAESVFRLSAFLQPCLGWHNQRPHKLLTQIREL